MCVDIILVCSVPLYGSGAKSIGIPFINNIYLGLRWFIYDTQLYVQNTEIWLGDLFLFVRIETIFSMIFMSGVVAVEIAGDWFTKWWRHQMEKYSTLLALTAVTGEFPLQRPVTRSFDGFFDLRLKKRLSKQSRRQWFETPSRQLWRHCHE